MSFFSSIFGTTKKETSPPQTNVNKPIVNSPVVTNPSPPVYTNPTQHAQPKMPNYFQQTEVTRPTREIGLYTTGSAKEKEFYDNLAELYAIFKTTEALEKAQLREAMPFEEYSATCSKLCNHYKTLKSLIKDDVPDVGQFLQEYRLNCPAAYYRLVEIGAPSVPIVPEIPKAIAEAVQHFITLMDSLKLNMVAVDQLQPLLLDLNDALQRVTTLPPNFEGKTKVQYWLGILGRMKASDQLNEEQQRQMLFDLDSAYNQFHKLI